MDTLERLRLELERIAGEKMRVSPGSGQTAYNLSLPFNGKQAIFLGVYMDGHVWTDRNALGEEKARLLANELSKLGITLDAPYYPWWKKNSEVFNLHNEDPVDIATRVATALFPVKADA